MKNKSIDEQLEELQNEIGMVELRISTLLAEKNLLEAQVRELLEAAERGQS